MSDSRPIVHLFCNAHIDPIWMWSWEEGLRETISTFRTAADLLDEFPEFVFNHNESMLYEWIEEYDPPLFERIRRHVKTGRWNITGGWYLQPDVNLPGGETLVRTILEGRRYFAEKFGVRPPIAYNFDSFGHPNSLPQLLVQSDFDMYVHFRPVESQMHLPAPFYRWRGNDGSEVLAIRPDTGWYGTPRRGQAQEQALKGIEVARATGMDTLVTWGLGDHGGGATRQDLLEFRDILREYADSDVEIRHSTPEAFLERIRPHIHTFPVVEADLQRTLSGTYTSVGTIKRQMREGEALLASAERWAALAWWRYGRAYPAERLREAWKRLMFNTFHDVLCGSLVESALPGVDDMFGFTHDTARRVITKAQMALLPNVDPKPDTIPLYVFNPHGTTMRAPIGINFLSEYAPPPQQKAYNLYDDAGTRIPHQTRGGASVILDEGTWQPFCGFVAEVPPMTVRRYEIRFEPEIPTKSPFIVEKTESGLRIETPFWSAHFSRTSGALYQLTDKRTSNSILSAPLRFFAMKDVSHGWGGESRYVFSEPFAAFQALSPDEVANFVGMEGQQGIAVRVIAQGAAWITVECLVGWQHTRASVKHTFYADVPYIDIDTRLYMQARRKMIKLHMPFTMPNAKNLCEVPYGVAEYPADGSEFPYTRWVRLESGGYMIGVANNGQNGLDISRNGALNLSVTRGGTHSSWSETDVPIEKSYTFMDQTQIDTRFRIVAGSASESTAEQIILAAHELNQPLECFYTYYGATLPENAPAQVPSFVQITPSTVTIGAIKKAETEDALIIRLQESAGQTTTAQIALEGGTTHTAEFTPYQIRTFKLTRDGRWLPSNLLEESREES
jgi:alpha-mannosidase